MPRGRGRIEKHAYNHLPGGSDPIPGLGACCDSGHAFTTYRECVLSRASLRMFWPMDEDSGNLVDLKAGRELEPTTFDVSGTTYPRYGRTGPFLDLPDQTAVDNAGGEGFFGGQARFASLFDLGALGIFTGTNHWTVEGWIYIVAYPTTNGRIFHISDESTTNTHIFFDINPTGHFTVTRAGAGITGATVIPLNAWTNFRVTYDGSQAELFINTVSDGTVSTSTSITATSNLLILNTAGTSSAWRPFNGRLCDLAIYDDVLTDFCDTVTVDGPASGGGGASAGMTLTADGDGGTSWTYPTIEVDPPGGRFDKINLGTNLTGTDEGDGSVTIDAAGGGGGASPADTACWMPLTSTVGGDDVLVFDAGHSLIPTLVPF